MPFDIEEGEALLPADPFKAYAPADGAEPVTLGQQLSAAFKTESWLAGAYQVLTAPTFADAPDYDPVADMTDKEVETAPWMIGAVSPEHLQWMRDNQRRLDELREVAANGPLPGWLAALTIGLADPSVLLPGAAFRTPVRAALATAGIVGAQEAVLMAAQPDRSPAQAAAAVALGGAFGFGLGATASWLGKRAQHAALVDSAVNDAAAIIQSVAEEAKGTGSLSAALAGFTRDSLSAEDTVPVAAGVLGPIVRKLASWGLASPGAALALSDNPAVRKLAAQLVDTGLVVQGHLKGLAFEPSLDTTIRLRKTLAQTAATDIFNAGWAEWRRGGGASSLEDFYREVDLALRSGDAHPVAAVAKTAQSLRQVIYAPLGKEATDAGLIKGLLFGPEGVGQGVSYAPQHLDVNKILANAEKFRKEAGAELKAKVEAANDLVRAAAAAEEEAKRLRARYANLEAQFNEQVRAMPGRGGHGAARRKLAEGAPSPEAVAAADVAVDKAKARLAAAARPAPLDDAIKLERRALSTGTSDLRTRLDDLLTELDRARNEIAGARELAARSGEMETAAKLDEDLAKVTAEMQEAAAAARSARRAEELLKNAAPPWADVPKVADAPEIAALAKTKEERELAASVAADMDLQVRHRTPGVLVSRREKSDLADKVAGALDRLAELNRPLADALRDAQGAALAAHDRIALARKLKEPMAAEEEGLEELRRALKVARSIDKRRIAELEAAVAKAEGERAALGAASAQRDAAIAAARELEAARLAHKDAQAELRTARGEYRYTAAATKYTLADPDRWRLPNGDFDPVYKTAKAEMQAAAERLRAAEAAEATARKARRKAAAAVRAAGGVPDDVLSKMEYRLLAARKAAEAAETNAQFAKNKAGDLVEIDPNDVDEWIEEFLYNTVNRSSVSVPYFRVQSGNFKNRVLHLSPKLINEFGHNDALLTTMAYIDAAVSDIETVRKFGALDFKQGDPHNPFEAVWRAADNKASALEAAGDVEGAAAARAAAARDLEALNLLWRRVRGTHLTHVPPSMMGLVRAAEVARNLNFARLMGSAVLSNIPDLARVAATNGFVKTLGFLAKDVTNWFQRLRLGKKTARKLGTAVETLLSTRMTDLEALSPGYKGRSKLESFINKRLTPGAARLFLLPQWTDFMKSLNSMLATDQILRDAVDVAAGKALPARRVRELAMAGLAKDDMAALAKHKDLFKDVDGLMELSLDDLAARDRGLAARLHTAVFQHTNDTVITPGVGDLPAWMTDTELGKTVSQFKRWVVASQTRIIARLVQLGALHEYGNVAATTAGLVVAGMIATALRDIAADGKIDTGRSVAGWITNGLDRGGVLGLAVEADALLGLATGWNAARVVTGAPVARFRDRTVIDQALGPTAGLIDAAAASATELLNGKHRERDLILARRLAPLQNWFVLNYALDVLTGKQAKDDERAAKLRKGETAPAVTLLGS